MGSFADLGYLTVFGFKGNIYKLSLNQAIFVVEGLYHNVEPCLQVIDQSLEVTGGGRKRNLGKKHGFSVMVDGVLKKLFPAYSLVAVDY